MPLATRTRRTARTAAYTYEVMRPTEACADLNTLLHTPRTCDILKLGFSA
jgi:hypothetical protein